MYMKSTSKTGLLLEARLSCDGTVFHLDCRIEECEWFRFGTFRNIEKALKGMTMFFTDSKIYRH